MDYVLFCDEIDTYQKTGQMSDNLKRFWSDFTNHLPEDLKHEALTKGFSLKTHPLENGNSIDKFHHYNMFYINNASAALRNVLRETTNVIICLVD